MIIIEGTLKNREKNYLSKEKGEVLGDPSQIDDFEDDLICQTDCIVSEVLTKTICEQYFSIQDLMDALNQ